jgi:hypothetical protein
LLKFFKHEFGAPSKCEKQIFETFLDSIIELNSQIGFEVCKEDRPKIIDILLCIRDEWNQGSDPKLKLLKLAPKFDFCWQELTPSISKEINKSTDKDSKDYMKWVLYRACNLENRNNKDDLKDYGIFSRDRGPDLSQRVALKIMKADLIKEGNQEVRNQIYAHVFRGQVLEISVGPKLSVNVIKLDLKESADFDLPLTVIGKEGLLMKITDSNLGIEFVWRLDKPSESKPARRTPDLNEQNNTTFPVDLVTTATNGDSHGYRNLDNLNFSNYEEAYSVRNSPFDRAMQAWAQDQHLKSAEDLPDYVTQRWRAFNQLLDEKPGNDAEKSFEKLQLSGNVPIFLFHDDKKFLWVSSFKN